MNVSEEYIFYLKIWLLVSPKRWQRASRLHGVRS